MAARPRQQGCNQPRQPIQDHHDNDHDDRQDLLNCMVGPGAATVAPRVVCSHQMVPHWTENSGFLVVVVR